MILLYHKVDLIARNHWYVSIDRFDRQMASLQAKRVVTLAEYDPQNSDHVVITFDGVYENVWRYAAKILDKWGYPYELFVIGDHIGGTNAFDVGQPLERFANIDMLLDMAGRGARVEWHTATHTRLENLAADKLARELDIPLALRNSFDSRHFRWFAYPHDVGGESGVAQAVRSRFDGALACAAGNAHDQYRLNRVTVDETTSFAVGTTSIIIANYNYGAYLPEAIDSVLRQTCPPDELVIIDDASTDDSARIMADYSDRARIIVNETNLGIVENFRKAVGATSGDYIGFLGADNRMRSDYVERTRSALDSASDAAVAYTDMAIFGPLGALLADKVGAHELRSGKIFLWQFPDPTPERVSTIDKGNFIHGSSLYRRSWYDQVGGYRSTIRAEDWHLFARMLQAGGRAIRVPYPLIEYRQHSVAQANTVLGLQHRIAVLTNQIAHLKSQLKGAPAPTQFVLNSYKEQLARLYAKVHLPILGYALQTEILSQPIWHDEWMPKSVRLKFRACRSLNQVVLRGIIHPAMPDTERHFTLTMPNGTAEFRVTAKGTFELAAALSVDQGVDFVLGIDCDRDFVPAEMNLNADRRHLAYRLETITFNGD